MINSLKTVGRVRPPRTTSLLPGHVTFSDYITDLTKGDFIRPLLNSIAVAVGTTMVTVVIGGMAGYALSRTRIRGKSMVLGYILLATFFPVMAIARPMFGACLKLGLLDTLPGLVIPRELEEAAIADGTIWVQALLKVVVPVAMPAVFTVVILSFILVWNDFTFAVSFMTTSNNYTARWPSTISAVPVPGLL